MIKTAQRREFAHLAKFCVGDGDGAGRRAVFGGVFRAVIEGEVFQIHADVARVDIAKVLGRPVGRSLVGKARHFGLQVLKKQPQVAGIGVARQGLRGRLDGAKKVGADGGQLQQHLARQQGDLMGVLLGIGQFFRHADSLSTEKRQLVIARPSGREKRHIFSQKLSFTNSCLWQLIRKRQTDNAPLTVLCAKQLPMATDS